MHTTTTNPDPPHRRRGPIRGGRPGTHEARPRSRRIALDPGGPYVLAGVLILAAWVLIPAAADRDALSEQLHDLEQRHAALAARTGDQRQAIQDLARVVAPPTDSDTEIDPADRDLLRRLSMAMLRRLPAGQTEALVDRDVRQAMVERIVPPVSPVPPAAAIEAEPSASRLERLVSGPSRLWLAAAAAFCLFFGLVLGSPGTPASATVRPGPGKRTASGRDPARRTVKPDPGATTVQAAVRRHRSRQAPRAHAGPPSPDSRCLAARSPSAFAPDQPDRTSIEGDLPSSAKAATIPPPTAATLAESRGPAGDSGAGAQGDAIADRRAPSETGSIASGPPTDQTEIENEYRHPGAADSAAAPDHQTPSTEVPKEQVMHGAVLEAPPVAELLEADLDPAAAAPLHGDAETGTDVGAVAEVRPSAEADRGIASPVRSASPGEMASAQPVAAGYDDDEDDDLLDDDDEDDDVEDESEDDDGFWYEDDEDEDEDEDDEDDGEEEADDEESGEEEEEEDDEYVYEYVDDDEEDADEEDDEDDEDEDEDEDEGDEAADDDGYVYEYVDEDEEDDGDEDDDDDEDDDEDGDEEDGDEDGDEDDDEDDEDEEYEYVYEYVDDDDAEGDDAEDEEDEDLDEDDEESKRS